MDAGDDLQDCVAQFATAVVGNLLGTGQELPVGLLGDVVGVHRTQRDGGFDVPQDRPASLDAAVRVHRGVPRIRVGDQQVVEPLDAGEDVPLEHLVFQVGLHPVEQLRARDPRVGIERHLPLLGTHLCHRPGAEVLEVVLPFDLLAERLDVLGVGPARGWRARFVRGFAHYWDLGPGLG